jgi:hypothetical protein
MDTPNGHAPMDTFPMDTVLPGLAREGLALVSGRLFQNDSSRSKNDR